MLTMPTEAHLAAADKILDELKSPIRLWLQSQGLEPVNEDRRYVWTAIANHLKAVKLMAEGQLWLKSQSALLQSRYGVSNYRAVTKEISRRFVRAVMDKCDGTAESQAVVLGDTSELDLLPAHLLWVSQHRGLMGEDDDPLRKTRAALYEKEHPAPNDTAVNLYLHCRQDKAARQKMFDEVNRVLLEHRKKRKEQTVSEQDVREAARVLDMKAELAKMIARA